MRTRWLNAFALVAVVVAIALVVAANSRTGKSTHLLNVSYDPTREVFAELNRQFTMEYARQTGRRLVIQQSHGGSARQAQAVLDGLQADIVTLALATDVDALSNRGLIAAGWEKRLPHNSQPWNSTIVFVVRRGNPRQIHDWPDLVRPGVSVIAADPNTSGSGKLAVLAAWGSVTFRGGSEEEARDYLRRLYAHAVVVNAGARSAANTFTVEKRGDVQLAWENEARRETLESDNELEVVYPPVSIRAEPCVAWVDANVAQGDAERDAQAYLEFLFSDQAQETIARFGYRPVTDKALAKHARSLPKIDLFPVSALARDWNDAVRKFFAADGIFNAIYKPKATP